MNKSLYYFIMSGLIVCSILLILYGFFATFHQRTPVVFTANEFPAWVEGDQLYFNTSFCRFTESTAIVNRQFVDGVIYYTVPAVAPPIPKGCYTDMTRSIELPSTLPDGTYTLVSTISIRVNPFAVRSVTWKTIPFTVNRTGN